MRWKIRRVLTLLVVVGAMGIVYHLFTLNADMLAYLPVVKDVPVCAMPEQNTPSETVALKTVRLETGLTRPTTSVQSLPAIDTRIIELIERALQQLERYKIPGKTHSRQNNKSDHEALKKRTADLTFNASWTQWKAFHDHITLQALYAGSDPTIDVLLHNLATIPIVRLRQMTVGTQLKLVFYLEDGSKALFKPMRFSREYETLPDHPYFVDFERHNAEIAAFHLDRVLEFHRVPPTAGRVINVTSDVLRLADEDLEDTFFVSPAGNRCFHGHCKYYCDTTHAVCGRPYLLEGSMAAFLPADSGKFERKTWSSPWKRSYHKRKRMAWETSPETYCANVTLSAPYRHGRQLLDLIDASVFDFLTGNMDRHHYETFQSFGDDVFIILLDNGRAFGRAGVDELSILAPLVQCCRVRRSTVTKLLRYETGPRRLSDDLRRSLASDKLPDLLVDGHLTALDRRIGIILEVVYKCLLNRKWKDVILDDGF